MLFDHDTTDRIKSEGFMGIGKDIPEDVDCTYRDFLAFEYFGEMSADEPHGRGI